jgi:hypothetical protein
VAEDVKSNASGVADTASGLADKASDVADKVRVCNVSELQRHHRRLRCVFSMLADGDVAQQKALAFAQCSAREANFRNLATCHCNGQMRCSIDRPQPSDFHR